MMRVTLLEPMAPERQLLMLNEYGDVVDFVEPRDWLVRGRAKGREQFEVYRTLHGWAFEGEGAQHGEG